jgi:predicted dehydrogenase
MKTLSSTTSRRQFLRRSAGVAASVMIVPSHVVARGAEPPPSARLNIAAIGVGGMGAGDIGAVAPGNNIVALCDVDDRQAAGTQKKFPQAKRFKDFRRMFDAMEKEIDAVVVATPDHFHAVASMAAIKRGKHVYCEKPLAHSVHEVRALMAAAREHKVVTQLGNQGHSFDSIRDFCEWIWAGAIGKVHTIHAGCSAVNSGVDQLPKLKESHAIPAGVDWDLWLGPSPERAYHPAYLPSSWRGWVPFGNGTVGDWACHVLDPVFWALDLGAPTRLVSDVQDYDPKTQGDAFPKGEVISFDFPAKGDRGPIKLHWYSGTRKIPRPPEMDADDRSIDTGAVVIGERGTIVYGSHGAGGVRLIPHAKMDSFRKPAKVLTRGLEHHQDWLAAIKQGRKAGSDFAAYGGPLTEIAMLGVISLKFPGQPLEWDAQATKFTNFAEANAFVNPPYRAGWSL